MSDTTLMPPPTPDLDASLELIELVARIVEKRGEQSRISPVMIANDCMAILDPRMRSVPRVYQGCHFYLRQLARAALARAYDPADRKKRDRDKNAVGDLLFKLQARYPEAHTGDLDDPVYVRREEMTKEDARYNRDRLRSEGRTKIAHGDAVEAWWNSTHPDDPL